MAQLRLDKDEFEKRGVNVLIIGPDGPNAFKRYWMDESMPFTGLADIRNKVADEFHQQVNWLKLGRMPAMVLVDKDGFIRWSHFGSSMADIPDDKEVLAILDGLMQEEAIRY